MPSVAVELSVRAPVDLVWAAVVDITSYPSYMDNVRSVAVEATTPEGVRRSSWSVLLKGSVLEWVEDEVIDHERRTVDFHQVDGDLERFSGSWVVAAADGDVSLVRLTVDFEIGIPLLADMLNPVAVRALRENSERMLSEIELRAAEMVSDVRDRA